MFIYIHIYAMVFSILPLAFLIDINHTGNRLRLQEVLLVHQAICMVILIGCLTIQVRGVL